MSVRSFTCSPDSVCLCVCVSCRLFPEWTLTCLPVRPLDQADLIRELKLEAAAALLFASSVSQESKLALLLFQQL